MNASPPSPVTFVLDGIQARTGVDQAELRGAVEGLQRRRDPDLVEYAPANQLGYQFIEEMPLGSITSYRRGTDLSYQRRKRRAIIDAAG